MRRILAVAAFALSASALAARPVAAQQPTAADVAALQARVAVLEAVVASLLARVDSLEARAAAPLTEAAPAPGRFTNPCAVRPLKAWTDNEVLTAITNGNDATSKAASIEWGCRGIQ